jgi:putative ABC transport system substrate-binding protein
VVIPIVFAYGGDPVEDGLVASLDRPGGNVTGVIYLAEDLGGKRLSLLGEMVPQATTVAFLPGLRAQRQISQMLAAASSAGWQVIVLEIRTDDDIDAVFATLVERRADALIVGVAPILRRNLNKIVTQAAHHMIPAIYPFRDYVSGGGLMSYSGSVVGTYFPTGIYVGRILKGAKPADLPVQLSRDFELVINLKTAKALGLTVPRILLAAANEVIE